MKKSSPTRHSSPQPASRATEPPAAAWTFLTNHAHVLWCIFREPEIRLREIAELVGITERMVQKIVGELVAANYLEIEKRGRRNAYRVLADQPLRHPLEAHCQMGQLLELLKMTQPAARRRVNRDS
ncbi:MAG: hypothetical protein SFU86_20155 [Pirellulaceae bacterium]|nr:hypothetical protein [Pirellulaceae bacterium]